MQNEELNKLRDMYEKYVENGIFWENMVQSYKNGEIWFPKGRPMTMRFEVSKPGFPYQIIEFREYENGVRETWGIQVDKFKTEKETCLKREYDAEKLKTAGYIDVSPAVKSANFLAAYGRLTDNIARTIFAATCMTDTVKDGDKP